MMNNRIKTKKNENKLIKLGSFFIIFDLFYIYAKSNSFYDF